MPTTSRETVELMGLRFDVLDEQATIGRVLDALDAGNGGWLCPVNLDVLRQCHERVDLRQLVGDASLVVADGMPLVWASRIAGSPLPERVAGSSLILTLTAGCAARGRSVFLLGGNPGAADAAARVLRDRLPDLRMAGSLCPPFGFERDPQERHRIDAALRESAPDLVYVGLGFPKQDRLIHALRDVLPQAWFVSCGISFSFVSGEVHRAPQLLQILGLEWVHRLAQEPRRLARRYLLDGPPFLLRLLTAALVQRGRASL